jgi:hypothetical protein
MMKNPSDPMAAPQRRRHHCPGYLLPTPTEQGWIVDHWSASGDSVGWLAGPFEAEVEALRNARVLGLMLDCEVAR